MIDYKEDDSNQIVELTVEGQVTTADFDAMAQRLESFVKRHGSIRMLEVIKDFRGIEPTLFWRDMSFAFRHMRSFSRVAVVTDTTWIKLWTTMVAPFMACEIEQFGLDEIDKARAWLRDRDAQQKKAA